MRPNATPISRARARARSMISLYDILLSLFLTLFPSLPPYLSPSLFPPCLLRRRRAVSLTTSALNKTTSWTPSQVHTEE